MNAPTTPTERAIRAIEVMDLDALSRALRAMPRAELMEEVAELVHAAEGGRLDPSDAEHVRQHVAALDPALAAELRALIEGHNTREDRP